ncbi:MAG: ThuA domain-containing protein, partial [Planctomycetota bacterium]
QMNFSHLALLGFYGFMISLVSTPHHLRAQDSPEPRDRIRILNFQGDSGYQHESKPEAKSMVEMLGKKNGWTVQSTADPEFLRQDRLAQFDAVIFNNNCGTDQRIFSDEQQRSLQAYIRGGGGFVGIHCAGAIWHEGGEFQGWYEKLIGTRLVSHPHVQDATLIVENSCHHCTAHLPKEWAIKDEWHKFSYNPREHVNVLISLDESSYQGDDAVKMGGDHPFTWYQYYDGGRSFFTSLGHTVDVYKNADFQKLVEGGIVWAATGGQPGDGLIESGLIVDLDADHGVSTDANARVTQWTNQVSYFSAKQFVPNDYGIRLSNPGSGRPQLSTDVSDLNGHHAIVFREDELINPQEDAFDHLIKGSGYTWLAVIKPYPAAAPDETTEFGLHRLRDVNSFFGNLRNSGNYEGIWGCFDDDLTVWCGSRSGATFGRFDKNNPKVTGTRLESDRFYVLSARMGKGTGTVPIELFIDTARPVATTPFPVNPNANSSKLAIGTERDATNHPGSESFDGEIARFLLYERPLNDMELTQTFEFLSEEYGIGPH